MRLPVSAARRPARIAALLLVGALGLTLAACADDTDDLNSGGSAFSQALFKDYTDLSTQAAALPAPTAAEDDGFWSMFDIFGDDSSDNLAAKLFQAKAELAQNGQEPAPEAAAGPSSNALRDRLVRDINAGKAQFPDLAASAQTQFDCWAVYTSMQGEAAPAAACRSQLDTVLGRLEASLRPVAPPPPPPVPVAPVTTAPIAAPAAPADFTVYFDFDSWTLTAEDLTVLTSVIDTARAGGQAHITVVGHTDTSGSAAYNQKLSVHRANVVTEALVDMGARRAAIQVSGVGETDLAVPTPDGVKEAKNRRAVIALVP